MGACGGRTSNVTGGGAGTAGRAEIGGGVLSTGAGIAAGTGTGAIAIRSTGARAAKSGSGGRFTRRDCAMVSETATIRNGSSKRPNAERSSAAKLRTARSGDGRAEPCRGNRCEGGDRRSGGFVEGLATGGGDARVFDGRVFGAIERTPPAGAARAAGCAAPALCARRLGFGLPGFFTRLSLASNQFRSVRMGALFPVRTTLCKVSSV